MRRFFPPRSRIYCGLTGLALIAACPPYGLFILAWLGLVPLFIALEETKGSGFTEGFIAGLVFNTGIVYWLAFNSGTYLAVATLTLALAALILALGWGTAAWIFVKLLRTIGFKAWLVVPFAWTTWEGWLTHLGEISFPWPLLALTQSGFIPLLQVMEFTGEAGVSFWVAAVNVLLFVMIRADNKRHWRYAAVLLIVLALVPFAANINALSHEKQAKGRTTVLAVQANVSAHEKWIKGAEYSWVIYDSLTRKSKAGGFDLAVWPETAIPAHLLHQSMFMNKLVALSNDIDASIITGASDYHRLENEYRPLNGAFLAEPFEGVTEKYAKMHLVPFGERVPFQAIFPSLGKLNFGQAEFLPGLRQAIFDIVTNDQDVRFPVMICYESIFPWIARRAVLHGANLLVTISNDAWYGRSPEAEQIAALSRFRCIQCRRAMVRAANTGISLMVDPLGREVIRSRQFEPAAIRAELPLHEEITFYALHGDVFAGCTTLIFGLILLCALFVRGKF